MKIEQQPKFQPITITLETEEEAKDFLYLMSTSRSATIAQEKISALIRNFLTAKVN